MDSDKIKAAFENLVHLLFSGSDQQNNLTSRKLYNCTYELCKKIEPDKLKGFVEDILVKNIFSSVFLDLFNLLFWVFGLISLFDILIPSL